MLDDFRDTQSVAYFLLKNSIEKNSVSHAYLIDGGNYFGTWDFVIAFVKSLLCDDDLSYSDRCNICKRIDDGNYLELKIIEPDGMFIRKEQLLNLQSEFSMNYLEGKRRVYVIKDCDKMNAHASNCLLKFLEEPSSFVVAILVTSNFDKVLPTIVSRCQYVKLVNVNMFNGANSYDNYVQLKKRYFLNSNLVDDMCVVDSILKFLNYYECNGFDILVYLKEMWYNVFKERVDNVVGLTLIVKFYYDVLRVLIGLNVCFFTDQVDFINFVCRKNSVDDVIRKLYVVSDSLDLLRYNLNTNLLMDNMIINMGD